MINDPIMLMSYLNTQLRDNYSSLDAYCEDKDEDRTAILEKLKAAGFTYDEEQNRFR
ncbi:MAG: DUF4250 domain-containing protein [Eubacteriales bacterium]|nr:DUF4250 domain-containing protein [Eubacteriales bacterium]